MNTGHADSDANPEDVRKEPEEDAAGDHSGGSEDTEDLPHLNRAWPEEDGPIPPEPIGPGRDRLERINGNALAFGLNIGNHF